MITGSAVLQGRGRQIGHDGWNPVASGPIGRERHPLPRQTFHCIGRTAAGMKGCSLPMWDDGLAHPEYLR